MTISLSDSAANQIAKILKLKPQYYALRISVEGGGCSGFSYKYDLVTTKNSDDLLIENNGSFVLIDSVSQPFLDGSEIDFVDNLMGQSFIIHNPNIVSSCGCGTSFSV